jgi:AmmeMemoRadiSam system protein B
MVVARQPAVADMFYPGDRPALEKMVGSYLAAASSEGPVPKAVIAPHAGYIYSGPIAASAYARLAKGREHIRRVVLFGPSHQVAFDGLAVSAADEFITPLGRVPVDREAVARLLTLPHVQSLEQAHRDEHSLEVHLPFLQMALDRFSIVPIVVGDATAATVQQAIDLLWGGPETAFVISSDLSHYYDYQTARRLDEATSRAIEELAPEQIGFEQACGRVPIQGLLLSARARHLKGATVDLRNSGDTAGRRDRVVGYGAYVFAS